jgi:hypothetical protein
LVLSSIGTGQFTHHANHRKAGRIRRKLLNNGSFDPVSAVVQQTTGSQNAVNSRILVTGIGENLAGIQRSHGALGFRRPAEIPSFFIRYFEHFRKRQSLGDSRRSPARVAHFSSSSAAPSFA